MTEARFTVRRGTPDDVPAVSALCHESWLTTYGGIMGEEKVEEVSRGWHSIETLTPQLSDDGQFLVATLPEGGVAGHLRAVPAEDGAVYLDRLHVAPGMHGHGIGRRLMDAFHDLQPAGTRVWLNVLCGNDAAVGFYERLGFTVTRTTDACGGIAGVPAHVMERTVGDV